MTYCIGKNYCRCFLVFLGSGQTNERTTQADHYLRDKVLAEQ